MPVPTRKAELHSSIALRSCNPRLMRRLGIGVYRTPRTSVKSLTNRWARKLTVRGSDPRRAHGLAPSLILADEPGQWLESTSKKMLAALTTSLGKVPNSRMVALGTMPEDASHWFSTWCAGFADYSQVYQSKPDANAFSKVTWKQANPSSDVHANT